VKLAVMAVLVALAAAGLPSMVGDDECATARSLEDGMAWSSACWSRCS